MWNVECVMNDFASHTSHFTLHISHRGGSRYTDVMLAKASIFYTGVLLFSPAISLTSFGTR